MSIMSLKGLSLIQIDILNQKMLFAKEMQALNLLNTLQWASTKIESHQ